MILIMHIELVNPMWIILVKNCKSTIVKFTSFRKRTLVHRRKKSIKDVRVDLTKKRHILLVKANGTSKMSLRLNFATLTLIVF